jgi:hypothetical protein
MKAFDLIRRAMVLANVRSAIESPDAIMATDGLTTLNEMIEEWALQKLTIPAVARSTHTLTANDGTYSIGESSGDFSAVRPQWINNAGIIPSGGTAEIPLIFFTRDEYAREQLKSTTATFPIRILYEPTVPNGTITLWPIPTTAATLVLYVPTIITQFANLTTDYTFPRGYAKAMRYNLAVEFCTEYGRPIEAGIAEGAAESLANLKRMNIQQDILDVDDALIMRSSIFNYYTGEPL